MRIARLSRKVFDMDERDRDRLRGDEVGEELAIGKQERRMADEERKLAREMTELDEADEGAQKKIRDELRREHWGHEPERRVRLPDQRRK